MLIKLHIDSSLNSLLLQEDTNDDKKITVDDNGQKAFKVKTSTGEDYVVKGTYYLSNLLQELAIAKQDGFEIAEIPLSKIEEEPVTRVSRMIKDYFWTALTRTMDKDGVENLIHDTKNEALASNKLRIYIPHQDKTAFTYYKNLESELPVEAIFLPENITPQFVKSINKKPGILSLKLQDNNGLMEGVPFVVPGGRFNEMYGWDSYFESVGLLIDGKVELSKAMADNFQYEIEHYGKILNANRSYYLTRTQPPFYSSIIKEVFEISKDKTWLKSHLQTAIKEYETVWMVNGKRLTDNGLNRYLAEGLGMPPECEEGHFDSIFKSFADAEGISVRAYEKGYAESTINNDTLDAYFTHDRTVRESGHDTSYRIEGHCADLNLVELNAMLYKYEVDFSEIIAEEFKGEFQGYTSEYWKVKANSRKEAVNKYLWNDSKGMYFDYNVNSKKQSDFIAATTLIPLWANLCTRKQAEALVKNAIPLLKEKGGIAGCTKASIEEVDKNQPQRQWDYPNGWAPHQMMIWKGLLNYGFEAEAQELIYRWLFMLTKSAVDYNGTIPEKYDVVEATHKVYAEYGNVGTDFQYLSPGGFGWMNASYKLGVSLLDEKYISNLNQLTSPEKLFK